MIPKERTVDFECGSSEPACGATQLIVAVDRDNAGLATPAATGTLDYVEVDVHAGSIQ